jgi:hypothetical protein
MRGDKMNKFEFNEFMNQFVEMIEEGGSRLKAEAEDFGQNFRSRRDINKLESLIRDDYVNIGLLVYELHKMGKTFDFSDFEEKFKSIDEKKQLLANLDNEAKKDSDFTEKEDIFQEDEVEDEEVSDKEEVICPNCGTKNTKFVAYCKNCGKEL